MLATRGDIDSSRIFQILPCNSAANSIPVGPPPTMAKCSKALRSVSVRFGEAACSKRSMLRMRIRLASLTSFRKVACSFTPGTPKVWAYAPTPITILEIKDADLFSLLVPDGGSTENKAHLSNLT